MVVYADCTKRQQPPARPNISSEPRDAAVGSRNGARRSCRAGFARDPHQSRHDARDARPVQLRPCGPPARPAVTALSQCGSAWTKSCLGQSYDCASNARENTWRWLGRAGATKVLRLKPARYPEETSSPDHPATPSSRRRPWKKGSSLTARAEFYPAGISGAPATSHAWPYQR